MGTLRVTWEETRGTVGPFTYLSGSPALLPLDTGFASTRRGRGGDKNVLQIEKYAEELSSLFHAMETKRGSKATNKTREASLIKHLLQQYYFWKNPDGTRVFS